MKTSRAVRRTFRWRKVFLKLKVCHFIVAEMFVQLLLALPLPHTIPLTNCKLILSFSVDDPSAVVAYEYSMKHFNTVNGKVFERWRLQLIANINCQSKLSMCSAQYGSMISIECLDTSDSRDCWTANGVKLKVWPILKIVELNMVLTVLNSHVCITTATCTAKMLKLSLVSSFTRLISSHENVLQPSHKKNSFWGEVE